MGKKVSLLHLLSDVYSMFVKLGDALFLEIVEGKASKYKIIS